MIPAIHLDPVVALVDSASSWLWSQVSELSTHWASQMVFKPLAWPAAVSGLYRLSRDAAWSMMAVVAAVAGLRAIAPTLALPGNSVPIPLLLERLTAAALMGMAGLWTVEAALSLNNVIVGAVLGSSRAWGINTAPSGVLSPLVVLLLGASLLVLMLYLTLFYAIRAIEIFVLSAAIPWFVLWWATRQDDAPVATITRELGAAIFVQSFQAGAFWLVTRLGSSSWGSMGGFLEVALMWYMTRMPGQLRRLVGAPTVSGRLWR